MTRLINVLNRFRRCDDGATLVEYGIALTLAILVGAGALSTLATDVDGQFTSASGAMSTTAPATPSQ